ncbi:hypothetical protein YC2023_018869 [Brassica napus]
MGLIHTDCEFIEHIVKEVKKVLTSIEQEEKVKASVNTTVRSEGEKQEVSSLTGTNLPGEGEELETKENVKLFGITQRLQKLQEKLGMHGVVSKETRIIGVLGMAGIGKTTIAHKKKGLLNYGLIRLLRKLLKKTDKTITEETTHESVETELLDSNVFLVLDNVSNKKQLEYLLGNRRWISQGSKVVIVTSDKSLVEDVVSDTYVVPGLNEKEGLECFCYHAFGDHKVHEGSLMKQSREFVDYARGNPLALKVLGPELRGRDKAHWESKLLQLAQSPSNVLNVSYDGLSQQQKEAFLDVTCFFRSENHKFVTALVDSEPDKGSSEIRDLADKFLIDITGGRVEMHNLLYTLGKKLASKQQKRLRNHHEIIRALKRKTVNRIHGEASEMEVINQQGETSTVSNNSTQGVLASRIIDNEEALRSQQRETRSIGNNNNDTNDVLMLLQAYSDDSELTDGDESQRMEEINQQGRKISIRDVSMVSQDSEESDESQNNKQDETNSCVSSEDQGNSYVQDCGRVTENTSAQMIKPVGLLCLMISISAGAAFILGKRKR